MRLRYCTLAEITIRTQDGFGRRIGRGAVVDLDEVIGRTDDGQPITLAAALGEHVDAFLETVDHPAAAPIARPIDADETE